MGSAGPGFNPSDRESNARDREFNIRDREFNVKYGDWGMHCLEGSTLCAVLRDTWESFVGIVKVRRLEFTLAYIL